MLKAQQLTLQICKRSQTRSKALKPCSCVIEHSQTFAKALVWQCRKRSQTTHKLSQISACPLLLSCCPLNTARILACLGLSTRGGETSKRTNTWLTGRANRASAITTNSSARSLLKQKHRPIKLHLLCLVSRTFNSSQACVTIGNTSACFWQHMPGCFSPHVRRRLIVGNLALS